MRLFALALALLLAAAAVSGQEPRISDIDGLLAAPISGASKYEQTTRNAPGDVTIVTAEEIRDYGYRTLAEVLGAARGFFITDDRNYTYVGVRGFGRPTDYNNRILLLIDGHTVNENVFGAAQLGSELPLDLSVVERIEIIRGPSSALYGTGGMLATVNVVLKTGAALHGGVITGEVGSYGRVGGSVAAGTELASGLQLLGSFIGSRVDGQDLFYPEYADTPSGGIAHDLDFDKSYGGLLSASYAGFQLTGILTARQKGIPTGAFASHFDQFAETTDRHSYLELRRETELASNVVLSARAYVSNYGYKGLYPSDPTIYDGTIDNWWGAEIQARWDPVPTDRVTVGTEYRRDTRAHYHAFDAEGQGFNGNFPFHVFSAYVQNEYEVTPKLVVTGGLRYDRYSTGQSHASPRLAVVWDATSPSPLKLLYGHAFRVPNVYEANYEDTVSQPNHSIAPERIAIEELERGMRCGVPDDCEPRARVALTGRVAVVA
jgi:iron complex outermembrane receptor protein